MADSGKNRFINFDLSKKDETGNNSGELKLTQFKAENKKAPSSYNTKNSQLKTEFVHEMDEKTLREMFNGKTASAKNDTRQKKVKTPQKAQKYDFKSEANRKKSGAYKNEKESEAKRNLSAKTGKNSTSGGKLKAKQNAENNQGKKNKKDRAALRHIALFILTLVFVSALFFAAYWCVRTENITVEGNSVYSSEDIIAASGISAGDRYFSIDTEKVKNGIEADPHLKLEAISFSLPDNLTLKVKERIAAAQLELQEGGYIVIDDEGTVVETHDVSINGVPTVTGLTVTDYSLKYTVRTDDAAKLQKLCMVMSELSAHYLTGEIASIDILNTSSVKLKTNSGMTVETGAITNAEDMCLKATWIQSVLPALNEAGYSGGTLNVSSDAQATYSPVKGEDSTRAEEIILSELGQATVPKH